MELNKVLLMLKNFFQKFLSASAPSDLLPVPHLLFKPLDRARLFFTCCEDPSAFVKVTVH